MSQKRLVSREEKSLWDKVMRNVYSSPKKNRDSLDRHPDEETRTKVCDKPSKTAIFKATDNDLTVKKIKNTKTYVDLVVGTNAGLDKRNAQRLKRGKLRPEASIDLHGHMQYEAYNELKSFLLESQKLGRRCVLVITGKGSVKTGGVLRKMVPRWLNQAPLRSVVIAIEKAIPRDGGSGAYYLLLRRRR